VNFEDRSNALVDLLDELSEREESFVLVGGYAVSSFNTRFSTDLDVVVAPDDTQSFETFLESNGFERIARQEKHWEYATAVIEYEKRPAPNRPIGVDLLVNGLGCRQTEAQWSFEYLRGHSSERQIHGQSNSTTARVVDGSVLAAAKLHSGRATDIRDVVAIAEDVDLDDVTAHLRRGDGEALCQQLVRGRETLDGDDFKHGFRSDFGASEVKAETVQRLRRYLAERIDELD